MVFSLGTPCMINTILTFMARSRRCPDLFVAAREVCHHDLPGSRGLRKEIFYPNLSRRHGNTKPASSCSRSE